MVLARSKIVGTPTWIRDVVVNIGTGTTRRAAVANGAGMVGFRGPPALKLRRAGEQQKEGEGTASFLLADRWSLVADDFFSAPPPCFCVCTGMIGLTGEFPGCTGIVGLSRRKSEGKAKGKGLGRVVCVLDEVAEQTETAQEERSLSIATQV